MGAGDELRRPGGAAGQLQEGNAFGVVLRDRRGFAVAQRVERGELLGLTGDHDRRRILHLGGDLPGEHAVVESAVFVGDHVRRGVAEPAEVTDLRRAVCGQGEDGERAEPEDREEHLGVLDDVRQLQDDTVALAYPEVGETGGDAGRGVVEFAVGDAPPSGRRVVSDDGGAIGEPGGAGREELAEGLARPVTGCAIPLGELLGVTGGVDERGALETGCHGTVPFGMRIDVGSVGQARRVAPPSMYSACMVM